MSERRNGGALDPIGAPIPDETLEGYVSLGRQFAAQMARECFKAVTSVPGWTAMHVEVSTDIALSRMEVAARDALAAKGAEPGNLQWQAIWIAIESGYRETMAALLKASGQRGSEPLH